MNNDNVLQAIMLLCSFFNKSESRNIKPLTPTEYSRLAAWLHQNKYTPADFLTREEELLTEWDDPKGKITKERLSQLLQRSASMGFALEKWQQQRVWVISRASQEYPWALRQLGDTRSPLLYGIGNKSLLNNQGIGFVGSRDINDDDEAFTGSLAQRAVEQGFTVVSGGAKGIDQTSMQAALDAGGNVIGVLADSLLKSATKSQYRQALQEGRLLLITPYYPEAGFSAGNAMGRNKYIYTLSTGVVVAKSDEKGGTWTGATENLKKQWVPLWVRDIEKSGNQKLLQMGGSPIADADVDFNQLISAFAFSNVDTKSLVAERKPKAEVKEIQSDIFTNDMFAAVEPQNGKEELEEREKESKETETLEVIDKQSVTGELSSIDDFEKCDESDLGFFLEIFYTQLKQDKAKTYTPEELKNKFPELSEAIVKQWLKALEGKGLLMRQGRKLAYRLTE